MGRNFCALFLNRLEVYCQVSAFADQIFRTGFVHADPHPGNLLVRRRPGSEGDGRRRANTQLVILDHGLYETLPANLRAPLCRQGTVLDCWCTRTYV